MWCFLSCHHYELSNPSQTPDMALPSCIESFHKQTQITAFNHHSCIFIVIQKLFGDLRWLRVASQIELIKFLSGGEQPLLTWWGKSTWLLTDTHQRTLYVCLFARNVLLLFFCMFAFINVRWDNIYLGIRQALLCRDFACMETDRLI